MKDLALWLYGLGVVGVSFWFVWHVVARFGWQGLLVKFAGGIDGGFVAFVIAAHQTPWDAVLNHPKPIDDASLLWGAAVWCVWSCILYADRPMRLLMKRPVKWPLYSGAVLVLIDAFCAGKGWL